MRIPQTPWGDALFHVTWNADLLRHLVAQADGKKWAASAKPEDVLRELLIGLLGPDGLGVLLPPLAMSVDAQRASAECRAMLLREMLPSEAEKIAGEVAALGFKLEHARQHKNSAS